MKILINASTARVGGALTHLASFLPYLLAAGPDHHVTLVLPQETRASVEGLGVEIVTHRHPPGSFRLRADVEQLGVRRLARHCDVLFSVVNNGPIRPSCPQIVWARNLLYFSALPLGPARLNRWVALRTMNSSDRVVFPTQAMLGAARDFGFRGRALVLAHPLDLGLLAGAWTPPAPSGRVRILVPTSSDPHKNLALLPAVSKALVERNVTHEIHVTAPDVDVDTAGGSGRVRSIERYRPDALAGLASCYDAALLPSFLESFSYPLLEMEALGLPIAASGIPAHHELGLRACLFDPHDPGGAADAVITAMAQWSPLRPFEIDGLRQRHDPALYASRVLALAGEVVGR